MYAIAQNHAAFLHQIKSLDNLDALTAGVIQPIRHLLGLTKTPFTFDDNTFSEAEYLQKYGNAPYHLAWLYSVKIRHAYLFDHKPTYPDLISKLSIIENVVPSHAKVPSSVFYVALMHLALLETALECSEVQHHLQALLTLEESLNRWQRLVLKISCTSVYSSKQKQHGSTNKKARQLNFMKQQLPKHKQMSMATKKL